MKTKKQAKVKKQRSKCMVIAVPSSYLVMRAFLAELIDDVSAFEWVKPHKIIKVIILEQGKYPYSVNSALDVCEAFGAIVLDGCIND